MSVFGRVKVPHRSTLRRFLERVMNLSTKGEAMGEARQHQDSKGHEMQALEGSVQAFVMPGQATKACHPAEGALDDPANGEQDTALLGLGQFDDNQLNSLMSSDLLRLITRVAPVNKSRFNTLKCRRLPLLG